MEYVEPWKARILLIIGGIFGVHRLYIKQIPEAFIFFSTAGVFLLGCLYDSFVFRYDVDEYNFQCAESEDKERTRKIRPPSKSVEFSMTRFIYTVLYGTWIGLLTWLACTVTFGWTDINHVPFICVLAVGVSSGVYIVGQCGSQSRELSYIWISAFSAIFILIRLAHSSIFRAVFFTSIVSTVIGNRSAKNRKRKHTWKHFLFWSSLYCMLVCVLILGCSKKIMEKQITATRPGSFRETTSVGSLLRDRVFDPKKVYTFFNGHPIIEYTMNASKNEQEKMQKSSSNRRDGLWNRIWSGDMFDEVIGTAQLTKIDWVELLTVFVVDILRSEARVIEGGSSIEPFRWAAWRNYLIHRFSFEPLVSDERINEACKKWLRSNYGKQTERKEQEEKNFSSMATRKACLVLRSL